MKHFFRVTKQHLLDDAYDWLILGGSSLLFLLVSLGNISRWSIWFDEAFSVYITRFNFLDIAHYTATDVHPPLYYWLLKIWQYIYGSSELALRSMSLVFMLIAMAIVYTLVRKLFSRQAAMIAAFFMALSPMMVRYSEEARMYGLVMAITAAATYVLVDAMEASSRRKWILYGVLVALGMWTHYFTALIWITHWIWRWYVMRRKEKKGALRRFFTKEWLGAHVIAIGLYAPWLPFMVKQLTSVQSGGFWIGPVSTTSPIDFFSSVIAYAERWEALRWWALGIILCIMFAIVLVVRTYMQIDEKHRQAYVLFLMMALGPMVLLLVVSMPPLRSMFVDRYLMGSIPFLAALFAITIVWQLRYGTIARKWLLFFGALFVFLNITGIVHIYQIGNYNKAAHDSLPIRQTVEAIHRQSCPGQPIVTNSPYRFYELHYYDSLHNPVYFIAADTIPWGSYDMLRYSDYRKVHDIVRFAKQHGGTIWFVGDWAKDTPVFPGQGKWEMISNATTQGATDKSMLRAIEIRLKE